MSEQALDFNHIEQLAALALNPETDNEQRSVMALTVCSAIPAIGSFLREFVKEYGNLSEYFGREMCAVVDQRNWLADQCACSNLCPMPDEYVCEHRSHADCTSGNHVEMTRCWIKAAGEALQYDQ